NIALARGDIDRRAWRNANILRSTRDVDAAKHFSARIVKDRKIIGGGNPELITTATRRDRSNICYGHPVYRPICLERLFKRAICRINHGDAGGPIAGSIEQVGAGIEYQQAWLSGHISGTDRIARPGCYDRNLPHLGLGHIQETTIE